MEFEIVDDGTDTINNVKAKIHEQEGIAPEHVDVQVVAGRATGACRDYVEIPDRKIRARLIDMTMAARDHFSRYTGDRTCELFGFGAEEINMPVYVGLRVAMAAKQWVPGMRAFPTAASTAAAPTT